MASRVARKPIEIPSGVEVQLAGQNVSVKGKLGELKRELHPSVKISQVDNLLQFEPKTAEDKSNALAGTMRALVSNMVHGVHEGFVKELQLVGVGYRAKAQGSTLDLTLGLSHPVQMQMPEGITVTTPSNTEIILKGASKQVVCQVAADIRAKRPPENYKGKGIRYKNERIILKEGKKK